MRILRWLAVPVFAALTTWWALALRYAAPFSEDVNGWLARLFALLGAAAVAGLLWRRLRLATVGFTVTLAGIVLWYGMIEPSNDRQWQPEVAVLSTVEVDGDQVTVRNIRNFEYRSETDFTPRYYDKSFDLSRLDSGDLIASYWMGDAIAHMFVSFGFGGDDYLAVSIETRKEVGESYSTLAGFFKQYELYYVVADERDLIGVRTNFRKDPPEDVYVYRTKVPKENLRRLFLDYAREINSLAEKPKFYNTATTNCTTNIWMHTKVNQATPFSWKILLSGYVPELVYSMGRLDTSLPFAELRRRSRVNDAAHAAQDAADFSRRIRAGLPGVP